uniref:Uncharacterized protein n=1 Tax=Lepeophtheirus salmonis TaxID=72036 RepID=A0A0K2UEU8_LEPSM
MPRFDWSEDINVWIQQAELGKDLLKIEDMAGVVPLFLDRRSFSVFDQLAEKGDAIEICSVLNNAFSLNPFSAFDTIRARKSSPRELVEVFLAETKNLKGLSDTSKLVGLAFFFGTSLQRKHEDEFDTWDPGDG